MCRQFLSLSNIQSIVKMKSLRAALWWKDSQRSAIVVRRTSLPVSNYGTASRRFSV